MGTVPYSLIQEFFTISVEFAVSFFLSRKFEGDVTFLTTIKKFGERRPEFRLTASIVTLNIHLVITEEFNYLDLTFQEFLIPRTERHPG